MANCVTNSCLPAFGAIEMTVRVRATRRGSGPASQGQKACRPRSSTRSIKVVNAGLKDPRVKARLAEWGATALAGSPADFAKFIADETEKWGKVIRAANIKAE